MLNKYGTPHVFLLHGNVEFHMNDITIKETVHIMGIGKDVNIRIANLYDFHWLNLINLTITNPCTLKSNNFILRGVTSDHEFHIIKSSPRGVGIIADCALTHANVEGIVTTLRCEGRIDVAKHPTFVPCVDSKASIAKNKCSRIQGCVPPSSPLTESFNVETINDVTMKRIPKILHLGIVPDRSVRPLIARPFIPIDAMNIGSIKWTDDTIYLFYPGSFTCEDLSLVEASAVTIIGVGNVVLQTSSMHIKGSHTRIHNIHVKCLTDGARIHGNNVELYDVVIEGPRSSRALAIHGTYNHLENVSIVGGEIGLLVGESAMRTTAIATSLSGQNKCAIEWKGDSGENIGCTIHVQNYMQQAYLVRNNHTVKGMIGVLLAHVDAMVDTTSYTHIEHFVLDVRSNGSLQTWIKSNNRRFGRTLAEDVLFHVCTWNSLDPAIACDFR